MFCSFVYHLFEPAHEIMRWLIFSFHVFVFLVNHKDSIKPINGVNDPAHEIMALVVLRKLVLQTHMRSHPVGQDV